MKSLLRELIAVNLRYVNPQGTDRLRTKGYNGARLTRKLINQSLLLSILFIFIYGLNMTMTNFAEQPALFTYFIAFFIILGLSQLISTIFNVFLTNSDNDGYLSLPITSNLLIVSKLVVIVMSVLPLMLPLLPLFILASVQAHQGLLLVIGSSLFNTVSLLTILFAGAMLVVFSLARTQLFQRHQKTVTTTLLVVSFLAAMGGVALINLHDGNHYRVLSAILPFYWISTKWLSTAGLWSTLGIVIVALGIVGGLIVFSQRYLDLILRQQKTTTTVKRRSGHQPRSANRQWWRYHWRLLNEPNVIMLVLITPFLLPVMMLIGGLVGGGKSFNLQALGSSYSGLFFIIGALTAHLTLSIASLPGVIISLDRENFNLIQSWPLSLHHYLITKWRFAFFVHAVGLSVIIIGFSLALHVPLILLLAGLVGANLTSVVLTQVYINYDYRHLNLTWTNVQQLLNRGGGTMISMIVTIVSLIVAVVLIVVYALLIANPRNWWINLPFLGIYAVSWGGAMVWLQRHFWQRLKIK